MFPIYTLLLYVKYKNQDLLFSGISQGKLNRIKFTPLNQIFQDQCFSLGQIIPQVNYRLISYKLYVLT